MSHLMSMAGRLCMLGALALAGLGALEKVLNAVGFTVLRGYDPWRLVEFAVVLAVFAIALGIQALGRGLRTSR